MRELTFYFCPKKIAKMGTKFFMTGKRLDNVLNYDIFSYKFSRNF